MIRAAKLSSTSQQLIAAAQELSGQVSRLKFNSPITHIYNPLEYAWAAHELYLGKFGGGKKRVIFLGMNPGPFGMAQTGVPFGEVAAVRDWMKIHTTIGKPTKEHPKRPVTGFDCERSEVSGRRLWGLFAERFGAAENFFKEHFVANYCPLAFLDDGGRNVTPDKLRADETDQLFAACDEHLHQLVTIMEPQWLIGVGDFAEKRARAALAGRSLQFGKILHPSPASPAANKGWASAATSQLRQLKVW